MAQPRGNPAILSLLALWRVYRACRKGKRQTRDTQAYEAKLLDNLLAARAALASASWRPSPLLAFVVERPKLREIHASCFADRVVHHLLVERLSKLYEPVFIHDSCANRKGKGTHFAVRRLQQFMRSGSAPQYALQLDIANFFNRIHRPTLFRLLQQRLVRGVRRYGLERSEARGLQAQCRALLATDPNHRVRRKGNARRFASIPPHKRLCMQEAGYGLPIGNLTSQFFANVYLNELDQFVKHQLKARHYVRYVDDFVLLHPDPAQLIVWREALATFLEQHLKLELKAHNEPRPVSAGVDFLGYIVRPHYRLVRRRVVQRMERILRAFARQHIRPHAQMLPHGARERLRAQLASYRAHFSHANSKRLWQRIVARHAWLATLFAKPMQLAPNQALRPLWIPQQVSGIGSQYRYFARRYQGARVLIEVGKRWYWPVSSAAPATEQTLIPGLGWCMAYRNSELKRLRQRWKRQGIAHVLVAQDGHYRTGFKRRVQWLVWYPPNAAALTVPAQTNHPAPLGHPSPGGE